MRSVLSRALCGPSRSIGWVRCIAVRPGVAGFVRVRSSIPVRPGGSVVRSNAFGPFTCALGAVGFVRVHCVNFRAPRVLSCSFECVRFIPVRPGVRSSSFRMVRCISVRPVGRRISWGASGGVAFVRVHLRASLELTGNSGTFVSFPVLPGSYVSFVCVLSIRVTQGVVRFVPLRSVNSHAPLGSVRCVRSIRIHTSRCRKRYVHSRPHGGS